MGSSFDGGAIACWEDSSTAFLSHVDCSAIEEMDPSLAEGHLLIYSREVPFELRLQHGTAAKEIGRLEPIRVKILTLEEELRPQQIRVELTSENDLFMNYRHEVNEETFQQMQETQKLMIDFAEYPTVVTRMLNSCIKEPQSFLAILLLQTNGKARLNFIQNMEYKFVELLSCEFCQSPEDVARRDMNFRYSAMKSRLALLQARLHDIGCLLKLKSPSLLLQLQKAAQQQAKRRQQEVLYSTTTRSSPHNTASRLPFKGAAASAASKFR